VATGDAPVQRADGVAGHGLYRVSGYVPELPSGANFPALCGIDRPRPQQTRGYFGVNFAKLDLGTSKLRLSVATSERERREFLARLVLERFGHRPQSHRTKIGRTPFNAVRARVNFGTSLAPRLCSSSAIRCGVSSRKFPVSRSRSTARRHLSAALAPATTNFYARSWNFLDDTARSGSLNSNKAWPPTMCQSSPASAHSIKGSSANLGAMALGRGRNVEHQSRKELLPLSSLDGDAQV